MEAIQNQLLRLPVQERMRMIDVLGSPLIEERTKARERGWGEEAERRSDAFKTGKLPARDSAHAFGDLPIALRPSQ